MRLNDWQEKNDLSDHALAERLGTTRQNVWAWKQGLYQPRAVMWEALKAETGYAVTQLEELIGEAEPAA